MLSVIKVILIVAAVVLTTANRAYAAHSSAECYFITSTAIEYMFLTV